MWRGQVNTLCKVLMPNFRYSKRWKEGVSYYYSPPLLPHMPPFVVPAYIQCVAMILALTMTRFCQTYSANGAKTKSRIRRQCSTHYVPLAVLSIWTCSCVRSCRPPVLMTIPRAYCRFWCLFPHANPYATRSVPTHPVLILFVTLLSNRKIRILAHPQ